MQWISRHLVALAVLLFVLPTAALAQQKTLKYAHFQPARPDQAKHAASLAFKEHVEKATNGSIKVEIFPAGQFGNDANTISGLRLGTPDRAVAHDGAIAVIYTPTIVSNYPQLIPHLTADVFAVMTVDYFNATLARMVSNVYTGNMGG